MRRFAPLAFLAALLLSLFSAHSAFAIEKGKEGYYHTGDGVRTKTVAFINVDVYAIGHDIKCLPPAKSKQAIIDLDCDKRLTWQMRRDVDKEKIKNALRDAYAMNGYTDQGKINQAMSAFTGELKEKSFVVITYDSTKKETRIWVQGQGDVTIPGADFMKGTWSIWFGKIDQPSLGDALISKL
jgi:hypothetical protein